MAAETACESELATAASRVAELTGRMKLAKMDGLRNAVMAAAGQGYTSMLRRVDPEKSAALAIEELRELPHAFRVECAAVDHGPDASHSYIIMWGPPLLQGVKGSVTGGAPDAAAPPPSTVEVRDGELFDAACDTAATVASTTALLTRMKSKGGSSVRSAVMQAARQGYTCTLVRVQNDSKDMASLQRMEATREFETVLVSYDPGLDKDMSFLVRWGTSMAQAKRAQLERRDAARRKEELPERADGTTDSAAGASKSMFEQLQEELAGAGKG